MAIQQKGKIFSNQHPLNSLINLSDEPTNLKDGINEGLSESDF